MAIRVAFFYAWRDRVRNWLLDRKRTRAEKQRIKLEARREKELIKTQKAARKAEEKNKGKRTAQPREDEDIPAFRLGGFSDVSSYPREVEPHPEPAPEFRTPTLWNQMPRTNIPDPVSDPVSDLELGLPIETAALEDRDEPLTAVSLSPSPREGTRGVVVAERADADTRAVTVAPKSVSGFRLPPSTLLHRSDDAAVVREDELREEATVANEKCGEFDVRVLAVQVNPGPVVTTFEFRPEAGVKYSRVTGLAEDLCLAMRAESILIERMAGKSTVGIQVPNHRRETIWLRDVIESENFSQPRSKLTLAMGKDINGRIVTADSAAMPHVLIAGSTGSGKSVAINAMIMSVLYKATPAQVRLIFVDPKRVELWNV